MTSAYPAPIDDLLPRAQRLAAESGRTPSRNHLMRELGIGAKKATALREKLTGETGQPTGASTAPDPAPRLYALRAPESEAAQAEASEPAADHEPTATTLVSTVANPEPTTPAPPVTAPVAPTLAQRMRGWFAPTAPTTPAAPAPGARPVRRVRSWPVLLLALPAFVAIWGGWVGLGKLTGFGPVDLLPGIAGGFVLNTAITLPIGVEAYAAFALRVWLSGATRSAKARRFAKFSAVGSLLLGMAGQGAYHLMTAAGMTQAPWQITAFVSCLPVVVLGCGAALAHLLHHDEEGDNQ
ncbi:ABC transporter permease [Crossiella sp. SN42]|uniref:ABC transporter permease n=1 Tax=Crossiella sp. SN42 TaxID=2944808 RepID=UPI00207CBA01|nr:ABC transporter permease [Crossiella sp. SN42]MCO1582029.1 ABC transporter permease [Crossiella sp. SN42]